MRISSLRVAGLMVVLSAAMVHGQGGPRPDGGIGGPPPGGARGAPLPPVERLRALTQQLTLTEAQQAAILPIMIDRDAKMRALRKDGNAPASRAAEMQQARVIRDASNAQIRALLTETQAATFDKMQPKGPMGGGQQVPPGNGSGQPPDPK